MQAPKTARVLVVTDQAIATPGLLHEAVSSRHLDRPAWCIEHLGLPVTTVRDAA